MTYFTAGKRSLFGTMLSFLLIGQASAVEPLKAGDALPSLTITDQQDQAVTIPADTKRLLLAIDNGGSGMLTNFLDAQDPNWLKEHHTLYLADIHKMPSFVAKMFALPSLREKKYSIALGREEADLAMFPRQKGCVTCDRRKSG
jgi:hypothetical protein